MDNIRNKSKEELLKELQEAMKAYNSLQELYEDEIIKKQKIEMKLTSNQVLSELMFQEHKSVMLLIDPLSGKIIDANKSAIQFYNYPVDQLRGMPIDAINILSPDQLAAVREKAIKREQNQFVFPHRISSGDIRKVEVHSSPVEVNGQKLLFSIIHDITDREAVDSKLKRSEDALRNAEEMGKFGNWSLFLNEKLIRASDGAILLYGFSQNEIPYDTVKEVALPEYRPLLNKALENLILNGEKYEVEYQIKRKSDDRIIDIHSVAEYDASENIVFGTIQDITERKRIENAMRDSEEKYHSLYTHMIEGAALHQLVFNEQDVAVDYILLETNPAFESQLNISREAVIGKTSREAYGVDDPPFLDIYSKVALTGDPEVFETYFPPLQKYFSISVYSPYKGSFATIFVDITERIKTEQSIRESESRYHGLMDHLNAGIVVHAADTSIVMANPKAYELLGLSGDQMTGRISTDPQWQFILDDFSPMPSEEYPVNKIIISKKPIKDFLIGVQRPVFNDVVWLLVNGLPTFDGNGGIKEILISFTDITERKSIEDNLLESQRLLHEAQRLAQIGVWEWDKESNAITWSEVLCEIVGRNPELPVPAFKDQQFVFTPQSYEQFSTAVENVKETGRKTELELEIVHSGGSVRNVIGFVGMKFNAKGKVKGLYGTLQDITERKQAELDLKISEDKFRNLVTNMQVGVLLQGPNAEITLTNPKALELLGLTEDQLTGITSFDPSWNIIHEDGSPFPGNTHPVPQAIATRLPVRSVIMGVYRPLIGDRAWLLVDAEPGLNDDGTVNHVICTFIDISKRKQAEELLRTSQINLNNAQHMAHLGSWEWDMKANTVNFSDELFLIFGISSETSVINTDLLLEFIHPDDKEFYISNLGKSSLSGESEPFEYRIVRSDGEVRNLYASGSIIFDQNHIPVKGIGVVQDITERKQIETALRESEERFRKMADLLPQIIFETDVKGNFTFVNKQAFKIFGYPEDYPIIGANSLGFHMPGESARVIENVKNRVSGNPVENNEYQMLRKDGSTFQALIYSNPIIKDNSPVGLRGIIIDITDRKQVEEEIKTKNEQLLRVVAEKDKFFSIIAHDLRSPFNGFLGLTQIMAEKLPELTMDEIQKIAVSMRTSATSLFRLLENLLHWARIEQGMIPFNAKFIHLEPLIKESIAMSLEPANKKSIDISFSVPENLEVFADINMLQTVIRNLVSNAVKYTTTGGKVRLSAKADADKSVDITVQDSGIGMSDEILANLFHINLQTNRKGTDGEPSTGLGLIICKEFIEKHGGKLRVESKAGMGSTFRFTIPYTTQPHEKTPGIDSQLPENTTKPSKGLKILIAEDDETSEMLISIALKSLSKEILKVCTGYEAVAVCKSNPDIDLILMDIKMPGMDGYEATRQIRQFNKDVFIIAQTAFGKTGDSEKAISEGFNDFLSKPLSIALLKELVVKNFTVSE